MNPVASSIRILVADDHAMFRDGLASLLRQRAGFELVGEAGDGQAAFRLYQLHRPDVVLMDLQMTGMDGIASISAIRQFDSAARIIALTAYRSEVLLQQAMKAGAWSYLMKSMVMDEVFTTIERVHRGQRYLPQEVSQLLSNSFALTSLTRREVDVLALAAQGNSNKKIATQLGIGEETVKGYMSTLFSKLGATDRTHAVVLALKNGIIAS